MLGGPGIGNDRRGASEVLGAILVFAILIAAIGVFQVTIVPQINEKAEFEHSTQVRGEMQDVQSALLAAGTSGTPDSVTVRTGLTYPSRAFTVNPSDPQGQLRTTGPVEAVELNGVTATDPEGGDFWNGSHTFTSRSLVYRPGYNYYDTAPTVVYEPTVLYSSFPDGGEIVEGEGTLIDGRNLNVVLLSGDVSAGSSTATVEAKPVSASTRTVSIENPDELVVKTRLSESTWNDMLAGEPASVATFTSGSPNTVVIDLDPGTWTLNVANVSVGRQVSAPGPAYVESVGSTEWTVGEGETVDLTVRVLDRYGNPVEGVMVNQTFATNRTTDATGTVTYEYTATSGNETLDVWFGSEAPPGDAARRVAFDVNVSSLGLGEQLNPSDGFVVRSTTTVGADKNALDVTFESTDAETVVRSFRVNFYYANPLAAASRNAPETWSVNGTATQEDVGGQSIQVGDVSVPAGGTVTFRYEFSSDTGSFEVRESDYVILTARFADGTSRLYIVSPA